MELKTGDGWEDSTWKEWRDNELIKFEEGQVQRDRDGLYKKGEGSVSTKEDQKV